MQRKRQIVNVESRSKMENLFENEKARERMAFIVQEYEAEEILSSNCTSKSLNDFIEEYNWDDGFEVPYYVMNHVNCDLGTALKMFYLSEGLEILDDGFYDFFNKKWVCFVELLYLKIKNHEYKIMDNSYKIPLSQEEKERLIKDERITNVFLTDIVL